MHIREALERLREAGGERVALPFLTDELTREAELRVDPVGTRDLLERKGYWRKVEEALTEVLWTVLEAEDAPLDESGVQGALVLHLRSRRVGLWWAPHSWRFRYGWIDAEGEAKGTIPYRFPEGSPRILRFHLEGEELRLEHAGAGEPLPPPSQRRTTFLLRRFLRDTLRDLVVLGSAEDDPEEGPRLVRALLLREAEGTLRAHGDGIFLQARVRGSGYAPVGWRAVPDRKRRERKAWRLEELLRELILREMGAP